MVDEKTNQNRISTKEYIDLRINNVETLIKGQMDFNKQHFELNEKAIGKAEASMLVRLESMNQFREQINSERANYITKDNYIVTQESINHRIRKLEEAGAFSSGRMWMVMAGFALVPTIIAIIAMFIR